MDHAQVDAGQSARYGARSMTTELAQPPAAKPRTPGETSIFLARAFLFWERLWPASLPALGVVALFIIVSLFGWWRLVPAWLHILTLILGTLCFATALWRHGKNLTWPSRRDAQARLEQDGHAQHAPLQSLDDTPFDTQGHSPLWKAHLQESAKRARQARLKHPRTTGRETDPYGLRYTILGLLVIAIIAAGEDWPARLTSLASPGDNSDARFVADLWIEPPAYTGKAPVYLLRAGDNKVGLNQQIDIPQGAILIAQINGRKPAQITYRTDADDIRPVFERHNNTSRTELVFEDSGLLELSLGRAENRWPVGVLPDNPPTVTYTEHPTASEDSLLAFGFTAKDDYAIASARLEFRLDPEQERPLDDPAFNPDALAIVRSVDIEPPANGNSERKLALDLQSDPWAGLQILVKIVVEDGAGQVGETEEITATLPARKFFNPLAKSVVEQRRTLSVSAQEWPRAARSFDAITLAPEFFFKSTTDYLKLRSAFWRVMRQNGKGLDETVDAFWPLALQLEDEALELARQRLEAAQEALRQALEQNASDAEIARLVEELRQAMNDYLTALAQSGQASEESAQNAEQLNQSDLDEMLDAIRDLSQSGANNTARQMLSDLENFLNNMRLTQGNGSGEGQGGAQGPGGEEESGDNAAGKTGDVIGRQRELADETFERGQTYGENGDDLAEAQNGLGSDLDDLIDELQGDPSADPDGDASRSLGMARNSMREAQDALENGDFDAATAAMERAITQLREGAEDMAAEQMRQAGEGGEQAEGRAVDPLGRPTGKDTNGEGVDVPDITDAGRTRAVIDELRRRLSEPGRTQEEIEYLERLLERF